MKKTWHTVFLILLICLDAALLLLPLLPGYRALFDIGPHPGRPPAFRFLKLAGYALFFPLTAYGCGRLLARIRKPRLRWLPAAVFALIATALVCLHNNELHMLCRLDSGWVHVPHMYENLVRTDLTYRGGIGIFRYVLPWAGTFLLCVLAGTYSLQQFLSLCRKAFAALRRRCLLRRTQARQALPCSLLVLSMADRAQFAAELADRLDRAHVVGAGARPAPARGGPPPGGRAGGGGGGGGAWGELVGGGAGTSCAPAARSYAAGAPHRPGRSTMRRGRCAEMPTFWSWRISRRLSAARSSGREPARFSSRTSSRTGPMSSRRRTIQQKPRRNSGTA